MEKFVFKTVQFTNANQSTQLKNK